MMWDIALMKFCLITKQTSLSWSAGLNKPHIFMLSALTKARIWTQKTPNPLEISLASAASKGNFPFSPSVPLLWACIWLFSLPQTQSSRFPVTFLHFVRPQGNHVDHGALPCASPLSRSCCAFSSLIPQRHLFILCVCVCVFSWRKNSGSPPISMKFHRRDFPFCSAGCSPQKFEWCHHFEGASLFSGPYSEKCPSSLVSQGLLLHILSWVLFPLVKMAILNNRIPYPAHADTWKP